MKPPLIANRTIQPTQVSGFNQLFDDFNGTSSWRYGLGLDMQLTPEVYAGLESSWRNMTLHLFGEETGDIDETLYRAYAYWVLGADWGISGELSADTFDGESGFRVETISLPLAIRYFSPLGVFGGFGPTLVHQDVSRVPGAPDDSEGSDSFVLVDAAIGYRLPQGRGTIGLEVRNVFGTDFRFQDDRYRRATQEPVISRFIPERSVIVVAALSF